MKIWTLVWFLVFPPTDDGLVTWEASQERNLTQTQCFEMLADRNAEFENSQVNGVIAGFEIYCKENE